MTNKTQLAQFIATFLNSKDIKTAALICGLEIQDAKRLTRDLSNMKDYYDTEQVSLMVDGEHFIIEVK